MKFPVDIRYNPVVTKSHGDFVKIEMSGQPLTVGAALTLAAELVKKAYASSIRYSDGVDAEYLAKCFADVGFVATPDTTLGDLIQQLEEDAEN